MKLSLAAEGCSDANLSTVLTSLSETSGALFFVWDIHSNQCYISPLAARRYNLPKLPQASPQQILKEIVYPADYSKIKQLFSETKKGRRSEFELDYRLVTCEGERAWVNTCCESVRDENNNVILITGSVREIHQENRADLLTGLLNQNQLALDYEQALTTSISGYLVLFGLDNFKTVNERHGHDFGDELLQLFALCLEESVAAGGRVYRVEGDCFAVILPDKNETAVVRLYAIAKKKFQDTCRDKQLGLFCTTSAGAANYPYDSDGFTELLQFAESAMNTAKRSGKNNLVLFMREAYDRYLMDISLREDLQRCVRNNFENFELHYQPQISVETGQITGSEALLRWFSDEHGRLGPDIFVPLLESTGLICQVGRWVIDIALDQCGRWRKLLPDFCMSINISYHQLEQDNISDAVLAAMRRNQLPGSAVLLELTESAQLHNYRYFNETLSYLSHLGVQVAIDDFGTGYSSLGYFQNLNINQIKIDRCFVSRIRESDYDYKLVKFITEMAQDEGVTVCVEGVETAEEVKALIPLSPDHMQGYYFGRPAAASEFEERFIENWENPAELLRRRGDTPGQEMCEQGDPFRLAGQEEFALLLDELSEIVYISDLDTCEIWYLNRTGRTLLGKEEYAGNMCYEVLQNKSKPCTSCDKNSLSRDNFSTREHENIYLGGPFIMRSKLISWNGKLARIGISVGIHEKKKQETEAHLRKERETTLYSCVRILAFQRKNSLALKNVLRIVGDYHKADHALIFLLDKERGRASCCYEWQRSGVLPVSSVLQKIDIAALPNWMALFEKGLSVLAFSEAECKKTFPQEMALLGASLPVPMMVPMLAGGSLIGFMGVNMPRYASTTPALLEELVSFVANSINQSRLEAQLSVNNSVDSLTGAFNHRRMVQDMATVNTEDARSYGVVLADVDGLRQLNQTGGYKEGDKMLLRVAKDMQFCFEGFPVYRPWGDTFVVLCRELGEEELEMRMRRLKSMYIRGGYTLSVGYDFAKKPVDLHHMLLAADNKANTNKQTHIKEMHKFSQNKQIKHFKEKPHTS